MKDFDIKKFLTENKITAASQQVNEEEEPQQYMDPGGNKTAPGYYEKQQGLPDPYYIFLVKFADGDLYFGKADKGMGGITAREWWQQITARLSPKAIKADEKRGLPGPPRSLLNKIKQMGGLKGLPITNDSPVQVDRAATNDEAIEKLKNWINRARKSVGADKVINKDTDETLDKRIGKAKDKRDASNNSKVSTKDSSSADYSDKNADVLDIPDDKLAQARSKASAADSVIQKRKKVSEDFVTEGYRRWNKLKSLFNVK